MPDTLQYIPIPYRDTSYIPPVVEPEKPVNLDSLFQAYCAQEQEVRPSLFVGHELPASNGGGSGRHGEQHVADWVFLALLLLGGLVSLLANSSRLKMADVFRSAFNNRSLARLYRENSSKHFRMLVPMSLIYVATLALLGLNCDAVGYTLPYGLHGLAVYAVAIVVAIACYFLRNGLIQLFGSAFDNGDATRIYIANTYIYNTIGAMALLPLAFITLYSSAAKVLFYVSAAVVALLFLMRLVRGMMLIISAVKNSRFYLFYYLCILEVVPILIAFKLLI